MNKNFGILSSLFSLGSAAKIVAVSLGLLVSVSGAQAASVTDLYLLSTFSTSPTSSTGVSTPFTLTGTAGVRLGLNSSGVATSMTNLSAPLTASLANTVTYQSHSGTIDSGESGTTSTRVNTEVSRMNDAGFVEEGSDANLNVDFSNNSKVIFKIPTGGFSKLMIAEDAGLDPFKLELCGDATCSGTPQVLFDGFNTSTQNAVLGRSDFGSGDQSPIDQVWLFLFNAPITGWLRISETSNFGGTDLEVDFIGGGPAATPEPTTLLLWGTTAAGLALVGWRRRSRLAL